MSEVLLEILLFFFFSCDEGIIRISGGRCGRADKTKQGEGDLRYFVTKTWDFSFDILPSWS